MPAEIQRVMNFILSEIPNAFAFIDDILVLKKALRKYLHRWENFEKIGTRENGATALRSWIAKGWGK